MAQESQAGVDVGLKCQDIAQARGYLQDHRRRP
jgi:hypothetical protein